jgi:hypothetical protein
MAMAKTVVTVTATMTILIASTLTTMVLAVEAAMPHPQVPPKEGDRHMSEKTSLFLTKFK